LSWLGTSSVSALTPDGKQGLFGEFTQHSPAGAFLRPLDGSPAVRLGDGLPYAISPDGAFVAVRANDTPRLLLLPTGTGLPREINTGGIVPSVVAFLTPKSLLISGVDGKQKQQLAVVDLVSGARRALTPPEVSPVTLAPSPDGKRVIISSANAPPSTLSIDNGRIEPIAGLDATDYAYQWASDGKSIFTAKTGQFPYEISRYDPSTRSRQIVATISTPDPNGVFSIENIATTPDGKTIAYSYLRVLTSTLYVVDGLR
jgi:Tol biopolymer transport system component